MFPVTAPSPEWYKELEDDHLSLPTPQIQPHVSSQTRHTPQSRLPMRQPLRAHPPPPTIPQRVQSPLSPRLSAPTLPLPQQKKKGVTLESATIDKSKLQTVEAVVEKYRKLKTVGNASALAVKLAKESFFGERVLIRCTVYGARDEPALPTAELSQLKQAIFNLFPQFWQSPTQFEPVWNNCTTSINQSCKSLRSKVSVNF